jgi:hypothetical protein
MFKTLDKKVRFKPLNCAFLLINCQILSVFRVGLLKIHFGSGAAQIRNVFFRFRSLPKISDPTGSGCGCMVVSGQELWGSSGEVGGG